MGVTTLQTMVRGTAMLALLALVPADARLYATPLLEPVPVEQPDTDEPQRHALALADTIPDLTVQRATPPRPVKIETVRGLGSDRDVLGGAIRFPRPLDEPAPIDVPRPGPAERLTPIRPTGPPAA